jgi:hypothetical protein
VPPVPLLAFTLSLWKLTPLLSTQKASADTLFKSVIPWISTYQVSCVPSKADTDADILYAPSVGTVTVKLLLPAVNGAPLVSEEVVYMYVVPPLIPIVIGAVQPPATAR